MEGRSDLRVAVAILMVAMLPLAARAQVVKAPRYTGGVEAPVQQLNLPALPPAITPHGVIVEDVVVRVNDQIISRSDVTRAEEQLQSEAQQQNLPAGELALRQKDMLRDMIDQQLLLSRAKELGLNADNDVIRQLDEIRKQNKMESMDDLEKAARAQGVNFEDFKAKIRNQILTQQVVRDEVGRRLQMNQAEEARYYEQHKKEFEQPEQIRLSEILVPLPEAATPAEIAQAEKKANELKTQIMQGADFAAVAKKSSGGPSAAQGGELGEWKRGALAQVLEDQTFNLQVGESTQPIRTRQGFVILKVTSHDAAGPATMKQVEPQIQEALYTEAMQPAMRAYLTKLREQSYIDLQAGFVDSGSSAKETKPVFTAYAPPPVKKKTVRTKARFDRNGRYTAASKKTVISSPDTTGGRTLTGKEAAVDTSASTVIATPGISDSAVTPGVTASGTSTSASGVDRATGLANITAPKPGSKGKRIRREKVRFGQAPRNTLPADNEDVADTSAALVAPAPGAVMASGATTLGGVSSESADLADNPLTAKAPDQKKTRYAARAKEVKAEKAKVVTAKQVEKAKATPTPASADETATRQTQSAPLGLNGDTAKKPAKPAKVKGAKKERLEDKKKVAPAAPTPVDPTASPSLAPTSDTPPSVKPASQTAPATPPPTAPQF